MSVMPGYTRKDAGLFGALDQAELAIGRQRQSAAATGRTR